MSRAAYHLESFPRRRNGLKDAGFTVEQFGQVISRDCFVDSKHNSHLFLMLDFDPQSPDQTSVTLTDPLFEPIPKVCQEAKQSFSPVKSAQRRGSTRGLSSCRGAESIAQPGFGPGGRRRL